MRICAFSGAIHPKSLVIPSIPCSILSVPEKPLFSFGMNESGTYLDWSIGFAREEQIDICHICQELSHLPHPLM